MSDPNESPSTGINGVPLTPDFLEFCAKVRKNDPSILPELGKPFKIRHLSEKHDIKLADALLENTNVTYLELGTANYTKSSAEAMAEYVRTSKRLQRIDWTLNWMRNDSNLQHYNSDKMEHCEEMVCCFLPAFQESMSLKELHMELPIRCGESNQAFENMLTHTQSLQTLSLSCPSGLGDIAVAAAGSGLKNNTTLRDLTLKFPADTANVSQILTSLRDHPLLRKLCLFGHVVDLTGLETVLLSDTSKITELDIRRYYAGPPIPAGLSHVLQALGRCPKLTKLGLCDVRLDHDNARLLRMALCNIPSLQTLVLARSLLGSFGLAELATALYRNTSIKVLDLTGNRLGDMKSAIILRDILRRNKTITTLDLTANLSGATTGAVECIADGLGSNSTLLKIDLSHCQLEDHGVSVLAQTLGSRNTTLQKITLFRNTITSTGIGVLLDTTEQSSNHITDLDLRLNHVSEEGAILLARSLGNNALPNLTRLTLSSCGTQDDGFIMLVSALERNTSLLYLDLSNNYSLSERAFFSLAESLPEINTLQQLDLTWCRGLPSAMPLLLAGLRKNTSLFRFHVAGCAPSLVPPIPHETDKCAGGWMQEVERFGYRNRFLPLMRAPKERLPPRGVWPHALARAATFPDVIFDMLCSKPNLVPSKDTEGKESAEDTGVPKKRKRGDE
jgi:Ran GTPase-activating protein (RanGAP) involved in mRNA processing and transport